MQDGRRRGIDDGRGGDLDQDGVGRAGGGLLGEVADGVGRLEVELQARDRDDRAGQHRLVAAGDEGEPLREPGGGAGGAEEEGDLTDAGGVGNISADRDGGALFDRERQGQERDRRARRVGDDNGEAMRGGRGAGRVCAAVGGGRAVDGLDVVLDRGCRDDQPRDLGGVVSAGGRHGGGEPAGVAGGAEVEGGAAHAGGIDDGGRDRDGKTGDLAVSHEAAADGGRRSVGDGRVDGEAVEAACGRVARVGGRRGVGRADVVAHARRDDGGGGDDGAPAVAAGRGHGE